MSPSQRVAALASQLGSGSVVPLRTKESLLTAHPDDVVITVALRTPLTRAKKGGLKDTAVGDLVTAVLTEIHKRSNIDPSLVEDVCLGNVLSPMPVYVARGAVLAAGYPVTTSASVATRFCSSGLLSIQSIANQIKAGDIKIGIAVGAESMSTNPDNGQPDSVGVAISEHPQAQDASQPMGWTSENVARDFNVRREAQDAYAAKSFQKAEAAQKAGWFADEIVPITTTVKDPKTGDIKTVTVTADDGIRPGTTAEGLGKIRAAFPQWSPSTTTGGNASQITDGAAGVLLMRRSTAEALGQPILGRFVAATVSGLEPRIMGIGPTFAIPKLLASVGLEIDDIDLFEINEAFSSMAVYSVAKLGLNTDIVNPRGGAIALGHPLGCTGARQAVTILSELQRTKRRVGVTSMCIGTGMGMAGLFIAEP